MKANRAKLEIAMSRACLDPSDIYRECGIPRPTLNNVLSGRNVRPATLGKVARAVGVDVLEIIDEGVSENAGLH